MPETAPLQQAPQEQVDFEELAQRLGGENLKHRLALQMEHNEGAVVQNRRGIWRAEPYLRLDWLVEKVFQLCGLSARGRRNFLDIRIEENRVPLEGLPKAFEGFRILQIADLHTDLESELPQAVIDRVKTVDFDICVNTGDFRNNTRDCYRKSLSETRKIAEVIHRPQYGILGNHDYIEKTAELEAMGIRMLLNESLPITREGDTIWLCGIDDPHFYQSHDISKATQNLPEDHFSILLSHSPQVYVEAEQAGFKLMLSGHTHGGQICLPGGIPIITHCPCPRKFVAGAWQHGKMKGYTSRGTGSGTAPLRFNCPPEITLHTLTSQPR